MNAQKRLRGLVAADEEIPVVGELVHVTGRRDCNHLERRQQQRAINDAMLRVALRYGRRTYERGAWHYRLGDRALADTPYAVLADELRGLTVVCQKPYPNPEILTAYWHWAMRRRQRR